MKRLHKHLRFILLTVVAGLFFAGDAAGLWETITGKKIDAPWLFVFSIVALGCLALYEMHRLDGQVEDLQAKITFTARVTSFSANVPDPGPDKTSIVLSVHWEIWVDQDVSTDELGLNVIYAYDRPWWKFRAKRRLPQQGLPPKGQDSTQYRHQIRASAERPFTDHATFEYTADRYVEGDPHWITELVLKTGMPRRRLIAPVTLDLRELRMRGSNPPL